MNLSQFIQLQKIHCKRKNRTPAYLMTLLFLYKIVTSYSLGPTALNLNCLCGLWFYLIVFYMAVIYLRRICVKECSFAKDESKDRL